MNSLKNTVANAQIAYSLDFTDIIYRRNDIADSLNTHRESLLLEYPQDTQPILDAIFSAQTKSEAEVKLEELDSIIDSVYEELKENLYKIETCKDVLEDGNRSLDACIDFLTQAEYVIPDDYSMTRISNQISNIISDLEDEKADTDDIDITELENELSQFMYPLESLIALLKKEIAQMPENIESPVIVAQTKHDSENEIESLTPEEHRITREGANAQDIVNLVNKILTNKELATHLALEAIRAERNFANADVDSCSNETSSK
jgi:hypothetical protein